MLYLYGDLVRARHQKDTLGILQRVIDMSVAVLKLHQQIDNALHTIQDEQNQMDRGIRSIETFQQNIQQAISSSAPEQALGDVVNVMGEAITTTLQQHAREGKSRISTQVEEKISATQAQIDQLSREAFAAMREFFIDSDLEAAQRSLHCTLDGLTYRAESEVIDVAGICCTYSLETGSGFFSGPRRFSDLCSGRLEIPIGTKKAWLKKDPVPETIRIDDAIVARISESDEAWEFELTPRTGSGVDSVLVRHEKSPQSGLDVFRIANRQEPESIPTRLFSQEQFSALSQFWTKLLPHVRQLYQARLDLAAVKMEGKDVTEVSLQALVISKLMGFLAPIVTEIENHSLIQGELSLTIEGQEDGKREVIFVRKNKLLQQIQELPEYQRKLFGPLGLERNLADLVLPSSPRPPAPPKPPSGPKPAEAEEGPTIIVKGVPVEDSDPDKPQKKPKG